MKPSRRGAFTALATSILAYLLAWSASGVQRANAQGMAQQYSGRAVVVSATALGIPVTVTDTGPLPPSGGALQASVLSTGINGLLSADVCHAVTVGEMNSSFSDASLADLVVTAGGNAVSATFIRAFAMAMCCTNVGVSGNSDIVGLVINGQFVEVSGQPNQTVFLPNGRVVINEQSSSVTSNSGDITVNALHIIINGLADVTVSSAHADIVCGNSSTQPPPMCDFVTGGGFITGTPSGAHGNFGVAGGFKNGAFWGHLNYIDHGNGMHVQDTAVTGYAVDPSDSDCRFIDYTVTIDGQPGTARVHVCDKGEPGNNDRFEISLSNGYFAGGTLAGGNIQLHKCE